MRNLATTVFACLALGLCLQPAGAQPDCGASASVKGIAPLNAKCLVEKVALSNSTVALKAAVLNPLASSTIKRAPEFVANFREASQKNAPTLVLLHGSGGNENSLMELASKAAPGAALLGIRGRVVQDGINRWYARHTATSFDQDDIHSEANAFAKFMTKAQKDYGIDLSNAIYLGYSNGANLLAALSMLHPDLVQRAALLRPMMVLQKLPEVNLAKDSILMVPGEADATYGPFAPGLEQALSDKGAKVVEKTVNLGHLLGEADIGAVSDWLASFKGAPSDQKAITTASAEN